jgi:hypothetical protein
MKLHVVGIDLGKTVFHLVGLDSTGSPIIRPDTRPRYAAPPRPPSLLREESLWRP